MSLKPWHVSGSNKGVNYRNCILLKDTGAACLFKYNNKILFWVPDYFLDAKNVQYTNSANLLHLPYTFNLITKNI